MAHDEILTPEEAAALLKLNIDTIRRLLREGKLPGAKIGRSWRIRRADLEAYLRGGREPVGEPGTRESFRSGKGELQE